MSRSPSQALLATPAASINDVTRSDLTQPNTSVMSLDSISVNEATDDEIYFANNGFYKKFGANTTVFGCPLAQPYRASKPRECPATSGATLAYEVEISFRCRRADYRSAVYLPAGTAAIVEGDRGVDLGVVSRISDRHVMLKEDMLRVVREASATEIAAWEHVIAVRERQCLAMLQRIPERVVQTPVRSMTFLDCEFQYDLRKLYVYFSACGNVEFIHLARYLNRVYRCRIWMHQVERTPFPRGLVRHEPSPPTPLLPPVDHAEDQAPPHCECKTSTKVSPQESKKKNKKHRPKNGGRKSR